MSPTVTIGLPVYNGERHLRATVESVLGQTYADLELVISDNASTDATGELCKEYAEADERVRYSRLPENIGGRLNFNRVFAERSGGPFFKWHGHDDVLAPTFVERCVDHLDRHPGAVLAMSRVTMVDGDDRPLGPGPVPIAFDDPTPHARVRSFFARPKTHQTLFGVVRADALARTGLHGAWYTADRALLLELSLHGGFGLVDDELFVHREHEGRGDYMDEGERLDWYTPERNGRAATEYWPHLRALGRILATAPLPPAERAKVAAELGRRASDKLGEWPPRLAREAVAVAAAQARRRTDRSA